MRAGRLLAALAVTVSLTACSPTGPPQATTHSRTTPRPAPTPAPLVMRSNYCQVALPPTWRTALDAGVVGSAEGGDVNAFAVSPDGRSVFAAVSGGGWAGVVRIDSRTGGQDRIAAFADPGQDQVAWGAFDGRFLVWNELHSMTNLGDWSIQAWDEDTGSVWTLAGSSSQSQLPGASQFVTPALSSDAVAWTQATATGTAVHLYSLTSRRDRVVLTGHPAQPVFWGGDLLVPVTPAPGRLNHLVTISAASGKQVATPGPLARLTGVTFLAAAPDRVVWTASDYRSVWLWTPAVRQPVMLTQSPGGYAEYQALAGDVVAWTSPQGVYAADLRSGSFTEITAGGGYAYAAGSSLLITQAAGSGKQSPFPAQTAVVTASGLPPLPGC